MEPTTATTVRDLMVDVVNNGTGTRGADPGYPSRGQDGDRAGGRRGPRTRGSSRSRRPTAPRYAISVLVENGGDLGSEATGGRVAAPIAAAVLGGLLGAG